MVRLLLYCSRDTGVATVGSSYLDKRKLILKHEHQRSAGRVESCSSLPDIVEGLDFLARALRQKDPVRHRLGSMDDGLALVSNRRNRRLLSEQEWVQVGLLLVEFHQRQHNGNGDSQSDGKCIRFHCCYWTAEARSKKVEVPGWVDEWRMRWGDTCTMKIDWCCSMLANRSAAFYPSIACKATRSLRVFSAFEGL